MMSLCVVIAIDEDKVVRECVVVSALSKALAIRDILIPLWGGANVAVCSRAVDNIPQNIADALNTPPLAPSRPKTVQLGNVTMFVCPRCGNAWIGGYCGACGIYF